MAVDPSTLTRFVPSIVAATLMVGLALWVLYLDFNKAANRAFSLFLIFRALGLYMGILRSTATDEATYGYFQALAPYFILPIVPALIAFVSYYPRPRGPLARHRWVQLGLVLFVLAAEALYLYDHSLFGTISRGECSELASAGRYCYSSYGPLFLLNALVVPAMGFAALAFAREYTKLPAGTARYSLFLVMAGFVLTALFDGTSAILRLVDQFQTGLAFPWFPWGWTLALLQPLTIVPALMAVREVIRRRAETGDARDHALNNGFRIAVLLPVLSALVLPFLSAGAVYQGGVLGGIIGGFWRLSLPVLATYALLRYHLFDIDVKVRFVIRSSSLAFAFTIFFFGISELVEYLLQTSQGQSISLVAAGIMTLVLKPVEDRIGERWANRVLPHAKPVKDLTRTQKVQVFREQMELALQDGTLSDKEREMLVKLQDRLGITSPTPL